MSKDRILLRVSSGDTQAAIPVVRVFAQAQAFTIPVGLKEVFAGTAKST